MNFKTYNVEAGFPSLDEARRLVLEEIRESKREGVRILKIIHGYGSSGKGGTLNHGLRKSFALRKKEGVIKDFIPGENFTIFNPVVLELLEAVPESAGGSGPGHDERGRNRALAEIKFFHTNGSRDSDPNRRHRQMKLKAL